MSPPPRAVVGLVAKAPVAGAVKTRLCPPLTPRECAEVAAAALADTADSVLAAGCALTCVYTGDPAVLPSCLPTGVPLLRQRGHGLAQRLAAAQRDLHARGYQRVLLLGADCPTVGPAYLRAAVSALDRADVVLGPAADGGYTLIGSTRPCAALFAVRMSTTRVLADTVARADTQGLGVACLAPRHDLDTVGDVRAAYASGQLADAPRTRAAVQRLGLLAARPRVTPAPRSAAGVTAHGPARGLDDAAVEAHDP